jgi:wyosine [tRNA(Phe)-imidazoG37] synthetase (radical SAM superfamily)
MSDDLISQYSKLIRKAEPNFVHVKGFKSVGYSRKRLDYDRQPFYEEVLGFAKKLKKELNKDIKFKSERERDKNFWKILGKENRSCVVVLGRNKSEMKIRKNQI